MRALLGDVETEGERSRDRRVGGDRLSPGAKHDLGGLGVAVDVPLGRRGRVARHAERAAHQRVALEEAGQSRLAQDREREVRQRPERDQRDLAGPAAGLVEDQVDGMAVAERAAGRRQLGVAQPLRPVRLGRRLERSDERDLAAHRDLDVGAAGELEHGPRVDPDLAGVDVARDAGHGDEVGVGRRGGVEQREAVVDAGVDIEDEGEGGGHAAMLADGVGVREDRCDERLRWRPRRRA